jgi:hypothetical protein
MQGWNVSLAIEWKKETWIEIQEVVLGKLCGMYIEETWLVEDLKDIL